MTDHIDTSLLESAVLSPDALGKESLARIRGHLDGRALCREQFESLSRMYQVVEDELKVPPTERDRHAADRILPRGLVKRTPEERIIEAYADVVEPYRRPIAKRFFRSIRLHPYQSSGAFLVAGAALALLYTILIPAKDKNPTYAEIKNYVLYAYNKEAKSFGKRGSRVCRIGHPGMRLIANGAFRCGACQSKTSTVNILMKSCSLDLLLRANSRMILSIASRETGIYAGKPGSVRWFRPVNRKQHIMPDRESLISL